MKEEEEGGEGGELGRIGESDAYPPSPTSLLYKRHALNENKRYSIKGTRASMKFTKDVGGEGGRLN